MSGDETLPAKIRQRWIEFVVRPRLWQCSVFAVVAAVLFYVLEELFGRVAIFEGEWAVWWPINGIALGVLLAVPRRHWWWILAGFGLGIAHAEHGASLVLACAITVTNCLEVLLPALALPKFRTMDKWLSQPRIAPRFILLAIIGAPTVSGLLSPLFGYGITANDYSWISAFRWGASDVLGTALFTPLLLALLSPEMWRLFHPAALPRTLGLLALMIGCSWIIFHQDGLPVAFVIYPIVLLLGTRLGLSGAVIGINALAMIATSATFRGAGPFGLSPGAEPITRMLVLQLFLLLAISMTLPVSVARVRRLTTETQLQRAWQKMEALAALDGLTGVANRRRFDTALQVEWARARRERSPLALLMIDADYFKAFNDNYGHLAGDACLRSIATAITTIPRRPADLVARYGGEEFVVLLPNSDITGACLIAEAVRRAVFDLALPHIFNEERRVTVSIGAASIIPSRASDPLELIAASDKALYDAKRQGRNQVQVAMEALALGR